MQDRTENIGHVAEAGAQRRQVNADSFRRLTALLKKPLVVQALPDLQVAPVPPTTAPAPVASEVAEIGGGRVEFAPPALEIDDNVAVLPAEEHIESVEETDQVHSIEAISPLVHTEPVNALEMLLDTEFSGEDVSEQIAEESVAEPPVETAEGELAAWVAQQFSNKPDAENPVAGDVETSEPAPEYYPQTEVESAFAETPLVSLESLQLADDPAPAEEPAMDDISAALAALGANLPSEPEPAAAEVPEAVEVSVAAETAETANDEATRGAEDTSDPVVAAAEAAPDAKTAEIVETAAIVEEPPVVVAPAPPSYRVRKKPVDAFSLTPDSVAAVRNEIDLQVTPQQEAESAELAQSLMDMMATSAAGGQPQERALAADTLLRLLPRLPARTRTTLAERLTMMDAPPPFLVAKLTADSDLAVSGPLLEDCMHISDDDLLQLIASNNVEKRRLIARRRRISRPVSEALAATGDTPVMLTLVRNQGAEISNDGFTILARAAVENSDVLAPLCTRQDLPVHLAFELFWHAPAQLRRYLLSRFLTDSENLTKILKITMDSHGEEQAPSPGIEIEAVGFALLRFMSDDASVAERDEQMAVLAAAAKVKPATIERILQDDQGEPLMALLKVLGIPRSLLEAEMHQFSSGQNYLIDPSRDLSELQAVFDQLSFNKARILLTYWDWATTKSGPYAAVN